MQIKDWLRIFKQSILDYHKSDSVDTQMANPYPTNSLEYTMYQKNWVDTIQWHLEDLIRDPTIKPLEALKIKRRIDASNQERTDLVEYIDYWLLQYYQNIVLVTKAGMNTESPAWAIDRLSILELKIYHMEQETARINASEAHKQLCQSKLNILLMQHTDLCTSIEELLSDIGSGKKYMKVYKQMKMYNDETLNPVLYQQKNN